mmetsp:Transcript_4526/g.12617  ORF Transcript_4526/g.12617 Transcript_4526/m.12617 type:complete len:176 (-) Transcript_4526:1365-1892(-)
MPAKNNNPPTRRRPITTCIRKSACATSDAVLKNSNGGVLIAADEIDAAFRFLDTESSGKIKPKVMKERLAILNRNVSKTDVLGLFGGKDSINIQDMTELLLDNELKDFDPVAESFEALDPTGSGFAESELLRKIFRNLVFGGKCSEKSNSFLHIFLPCKNSLFIYYQLTCAQRSK